MMRFKRPVAAEQPVVSAKALLRAYKDGRRDFNFANLNGANLKGADLTGATFYEASMRNVDLSGCLLRYVQLKGADLRGASLERSFVNAADLIAADFTGANMRSINFTGVSLHRSICSGADLRFSYFGNTSLERVKLQGAKLTGVNLSGADLSDTDIRPFCLATRLRHETPSTIDARTVMRSHPHAELKRFMLDCGVPAIFAEYMIDCARAIGEPLIRELLLSTFISYGAPDERFARQVYEGLREHGVIVFFFPETARPGERISGEVYRQLQMHDRVILVCSRKSLERPGVLYEIQETLDREARDGGAHYLLPIMLDSFVLTDWRKTQPTLANRIGQRIIADFRKTSRNKKAFSAALDRVIDALKVKSPNDK
jgi:hypothetical protein